MKNRERAFLDFYTKHNISPVSQDISDVKAHFARREALYRHLGIIPSFIRGKKILEFGPGSGHNALYTASLGPERYVLVDGNPAGLLETRERLSACDCEIEVVESLIESYTTDERFDMVMCEGAIPWQIHPQDILKAVSQFVAPGGVLVITCIDKISALGDSLRRLEAAIVLDREKCIEDQVQQLMPFFKQDLDSLTGMSRPYEDWILDQILQPFIGNFFSIEEAIDTIDDEFEVYSSSPHFMIDWSWYKEVPLRTATRNQLGIRAYKENIHNLMDYRFTFLPRSAQDNLKIVELIEDITREELGYERDNDSSRLHSIKTMLEELAVEASAFSQQTSKSLFDFNNGLSDFLAKGVFPNLSDFTGFFGRGQQYLSFIRK
jgi:SAM-dependent methyltransferase